MDKKIVCAFLVPTLFILLSITQLNVAVKASPTEWTVDDDGPADFHTLQEAINSANEGDTIFVFNGTYDEHIIVNKSVSLVGESKDLTVIDGGGMWGDVVSITASNVKVSGFTIRNSGTYYSGIVVDHSSGTNISHNTITNNDYGIFVSDANNSLIYSNNISSNYYNGINIRSSFNNVVLENIFSSNFNAGVTLLECNDNTISGNTASNNYFGIDLYLSNHNIISHNNFIDNDEQVYSDGSTNYWDKDWPSGGNYWSDYNETDGGQDGIGDSPYIIDVNNQDKYPLMGIFSCFSTSLGEHVNVVSNSTIEDFDYFESNGTIMIHVSNMTTDQTHGFCRLTIPHCVISPPYNITINDNPVTYTPVFKNETLSIIYFSYEHSTLEIVIIPEFPFLILPLFLIATLLAVIVYRRKHSV